MGCRRGGGGDVAASGRLLRQVGASGLLRELRCGRAAVVGAIRDRRGGGVRVVAREDTVVWAERFCRTARVRVCVRITISEDAIDEGRLRGGRRRRRRSRLVDLEFRQTGYLLPH